MTKRVLAVAVAVMTCDAGAPAHAQFQNVGSIEFQTSALAEAKQPFLRGVAILHSFGWAQAREQFREAQRLDPDFALAYWGESLAYNHPLFSGMDPTKPRSALARLAPTRAGRLAKAPTDREKGFLTAVEVLWGDGDQVARRVGYMEAMEDLYEANPNDSEVAAFYALSVLGASRATGDQSRRPEMRAGVIALKLFNEKPNHPGAAHYTIHSYDDPLHAPLALAAAERFAEIAPAVAHARHMPTHIFIQHGMWDRVSGNNQYAFEAAMDLWNGGESVGDAMHSLDWGHYGDLQRGDYAKARLWVERLDGLAQRAGGERASRSRSRLVARYVIETEEWTIGPITEDSSAVELLATGLSAARTGDQAAAGAAEAALRALVENGGRGAGTTTQIMHKEVGALVHAAMGSDLKATGSARSTFVLHFDVATGLMDEAVELVLTMRPPNGPATPSKPVFELYGELLLDLHQPAKAIERFETSLMRLPNRPRSLLGMARAQAAVGNRAAASEYYTRVAEVWDGRDAFEGYREAKRYLETTEEP